MITVPLKAMPRLQRIWRRTSPVRSCSILATHTSSATAKPPRRDRYPGGSAAWAATFFRGARWVKAFNTVYFKVLETEAHRTGDRVGIPLAADDPAAMDVVAGLVREAGFDPVLVGPLARGKEFEPGTPPYNTGKSGRELRHMFAAGSTG